MYFRKTMTVVAAVSLTLLMAAAGFADYYIEQVTTTESPFGGGNQESISKTWLTDGKFRTDSEGSITIGRSDEGKFYVLDTNEKTYFVMNAEEMRQFASMGIAMMGIVVDEEGNLHVPSDLYTRTGESRKVGDWNTTGYKIKEKYLEDGILDSYTMFVTDEVDIPDKYYIGMMNSFLGQDEDALNQFRKAWEKIGGYPVLTEVGTMGMTSTTRTTKVEEMNVPDSRFNIPDGYTEVDNPAKSMFEGEGIPEDEEAPSDEDMEKLKEMMKKMKEYQQGGGNE